MITRLFRALMPKEEAFIADFEHHAEKIVATAKALHALIVEGAPIEEQLETINRHESDADTITRQVLQATHRTFITPFDRREIQELIRHMDDAVDLMQEAARSIVLYEMRMFTPEMRAVAGCIVECARLIRDAVPLLATIGRDQARLREVCEQIDRIETKADHAFFSGMRQARRALDDRQLTDTGFRDRKEVYETLEAVVDHFDDMANVIEGIVLEQV